MVNMLKNKHEQTIALLISMALLMVLLLSVFYIGIHETHHLEHSHREADCPVCEIIYRCEENIRQSFVNISVAVYGILLTMVLTNMASELLIPMVSNSLIAKKVRMDN